ncbi:MAG: hypothetical protein AAF408_19190 [Pseudomonadota bacterium]
MERWLGGISPRKVAQIILTVCAPTSAEGESSAFATRKSDDKQPEPAVWA